jgi:hypothetical protein
LPLARAFLLVGTSERKATQDHDTPNIRKTRKSYRAFYCVRFELGQGSFHLRCKIAQLVARQMHQFAHSQDIHGRPHRSAATIAAFDGLTAREEVDAPACGRNGMEERIALASRADDRRLMPD